jgi:branched-chain amino acid transport system substrate-binding protein
LFIAKEEMNTMTVSRNLLLVLLALVLLGGSLVSAQDAPVLDVDAILANAGGECQTPTGDPLIIGYAPDFSEVGGFADIPASNAAGFMVELINCAGGVDGTPIEYIVQPADATDLELTLRSAQDLVDAGAHVVLGPPFSDVGLPLLNILGGQVPAIHVGSTEVIMADPSIYSFLLTFTDRVQGNAAGDWAYNAGYRRAVTLSSGDNPYFNTTTAAFSEAFAGLGGEVLGDYSYSIGDTDYSSQVNAIAALDPLPEVLYTANIMPFVETLVGQLRAAGLTDLVIVGADAFDATRIIDGGETTDGAVYTTHAFPAEGSRMETFLAAYEAARGEPLESIAFGPLGADAVLVIAQAYLQSGKQLDRLAIGDAFTAMESFQLITVESATYQRPDGPDGTSVRNVYIVQNIDGVPTLLEQVAPAEYGE